MKNENDITFVKPIKIGWVTTWNSRCGIATYSSHLIEHLQSELMILAPANEQFEDNYIIKNVKRCWELGEDNLEKLYQNIINNNAKDNNEELHNSNNTHYAINNIHSIDNMLL